MKITGYRRPDGRLGIRNHVLILPCSLCAAETVRFTAENVKGSIYLPNQGGCSLSKKDYEITMDTLSGIAANPNVYGTILIGNGCEVIQAADLEKEIRNKTSKPLECFIIREEGGSLKTVEKAAAAAEKMVKEAEKQKRVQADFDSPETGEICRKYFKGQKGTDVMERMKILRLIENMTLGAAAVGYRTESMHGAGSPQAQRIMISRQSGLDEKKRLAKKLAGINT